MYTIYYEFTHLNDYINAERGSWRAASKIKKRETSIVQYELMNKTPFKTPCKIKFTWLIKNNRVDADNRAWSKKMILDGMVKAHILPDDSMKYVIGFVDEFEISDKVGVRIERIEEE